MFYPAGSGVDVTGGAVRTAGLVIGTADCIGERTASVLTGSGQAAGVVIGTVSSTGANYRRHVS